MRIGFDFRLGGTEHGGIGRYSKELLYRFIKHAQNDSLVIFYNPKQNNREDIEFFEKHDNVQLVQAPFRHYSLEEQIRFVDLLMRAKLNIMHFPNFNVPVRYKRPFVVTIHDLTHHFLSGNKKKTWIYFQAYKYIISQAAINSKRIITVSESSKKDIVEILKVPPEKISTVYEGFNRILVEENNVARIRREFMLSRPYFLFVGVLERKKNIPLLTKAFDEFLKRYELDVDLVIAGREDPHNPSVKGEALNIKNKHRIVFTDYVDDVSLASLYAGAYAFVTASSHEGFGLPGIEAMSYGLPVIASNTSVFNEIYDNAALYFDPNSPEDLAEKMYLLANDPRFYEQCQQNSLRRVELFSWEECAKKTLNILRDAATTSY